jgi:hypothetical protein
MSMQITLIRVERSSWVRGQIDANDLNSHGVLIRRIDYGYDLRNRGCR